MKIRGNLAKDFIELENIKVQNIFLPILSEIESLTISEIASSNSTLELKYWEESGLKFDYKNDVIIFYGKENILPFFKMDDIFQLKGSVLFKNGKNFSYSYDNGFLKIEGESLSDMKKLLFKELGLKEGRFLMKIGFWINRILFYKDGAEDSCYVIKNNQTAEEKIEKFHLMDFLYFLLLVLFPIIFTLVFIKKPIFLILFLPCYIPVLLFLNKIKRERFFKNLWKL